MKQLTAFILAFACVLNLAGCGVRLVEENPSADHTQPIGIITDETQADTDQITQPTEVETEPTEAVTEPQEQNPYEAYIATVPEGEYIYEDLNNDGIQELFIHREDRDSELLILVEGKLVSIMHEHSLFLCEGGIIGKFGEGSGGMTLFYYKIEGRDAVNVDTLVRLSASGAWYRSTQQQTNPENMDWITKEEAKKVIDQYVLLIDTVPWYLKLVLETLK